MKIQGGGVMFVLFWISSQNEQSFIPKDKNLKPSPYLSVLPKMATAEKPKGKPQLPQGNLDDIDDSKTEYSPGSKADQTIQPGSLQAELQKVVHPGGSAKDRKGASNLESEKSSSQQETKDTDT